MSLPRPRKLGIAGIVFILAGSVITAQQPCGSWDVIDVPFDSGWNRAMFEDVAVFPDGTAWAVGNAVLPSPPFGPEMVTLAMHYDGQDWTHTPTPYVASFPGGANDTLHAVAVLSPDDVWAAGERHGDAGGLSVGAWLHVIHWDGGSWQEMSVPEPPGGVGINFSGPRVYDIVAFAADDVWFSGMWAEPNQLASVTWRPLAMHWNGSSMTVHDTPEVYTGSTGMHMRQMSALAPDDIWGICRSNSAAGTSNQPKVLHYDGSSWTQVSMPTLSSSQVLDDIVAIAPDDVWIFAHWYFPSDPFALHWDGSSWTLVEDVPFGSTVASLGPNAMYMGTANITLFDGSSYDVVETFTGVPGPSVLAISPGDGCSLWAVGRRFGAPTGDLMPFAARMSAVEGWIDVGAGLAGTRGMPALAGSGELLAGTSVQFTLTGSLAGATNWIAVGGVELSAPFKGGVLVPSPDVVVLAPRTDVQGGWSLAATWPAGVPAGTSVYVQAWIQDPAGPAGYAATAGVFATSP